MRLIEGLLHMPGVGLPSCRANLGDGYTEVKSADA